MTEKRYREPLDAAKAVIIKAFQEGRDPIINLDLDGVVADYEATFREYSSKITGDRSDAFPKAEHYSYVESGWFRSEKEYARIHRAAVRDGMFENMLTIPGAVRAINALVDAGFHIRVNTSRFVGHELNATVIATTAKWLDRHVIRYRDVTFTSSKSHIFCDIAIDDAMSNLNSYNQAKTPFFCFAQEYNSDAPELEMCIKRSSSWEIISGILLDAMAEARAEMGVTENFGG